MIMIIIIMTSGQSHQNLHESVLLYLYAICYIAFTYYYSYDNSLFIFLLKLLSFLSLSPML